MKNNKGWRRTGLMFEMSQLLNLIGYNNLVYPSIPLDTELLALLIPRLSRFMEFKPSILHLVVLVLQLSQFDDFDSYVFSTALLVP